MFLGSQARAAFAQHRRPPQFAAAVVPEDPEAAGELSAYAAGSGSDGSGSEGGDDLPPLERNTNRREWSENESSSGGESASGEDEDEERDGGVGGCGDAEEQGPSGEEASTDGVVVGGTRLGVKASGEGAGLDVAAATGDAVTRDVGGLSLQQGAK